MPSILNEKQILIIPLLAKLREYNPNIGAYETSSLNDSLNYNIKVANGRITITDHLINAFENAPSSIKPQQYRQAALQFIPTDVSVSTKQLIQHVPAKNKSNWLIYLLALGLVGLIALTLLQSTKAAEALMLNNPATKTNTLLKPVDACYGNSLCSAGSRYGISTKPKTITVNTYM
ncbi:MAG: hypothetical protein EOO47_27700 [Flavobacterium sp.]|nr:MAG: hypothetical protein EOO47_27700 [Flavobacterium sp.]